METAAIILVIFFSTLLGGQLLGLLMGSSLEEGEKASLWWFLGLSGLVLGLQNLIYLGMPLRSSGYLLMAFFLCCSVMRPIWFRRIWMEWRGVDKAPMYMALGVFFLQGLGLFLRGCRQYVGRGWHDLYNYVATAQFLTDFPFRSFWDGNTETPYLAIGLAKKDDRIGQSILHGFFSVITGQDAAAVVGPLILMGAPLTALAVHLLIQRYGLSKRTSIWGGLFAGSLPALAMLHLEGFLSQVLALPFLLLWPYILSRCFEKPCLSWTLFAAAFLAAGISLYTEFLPIMVGAAAVFVCFAGLSRGLQGWERRLGLGLGIGLAAIAWNPFFAPRAWKILHRLGSPGILDGIYPWAGQWQGLAILFFGDAVAKLPLFWQGVTTGCSLLLVLFAFAGLVTGSHGKNLPFGVTILSLWLLPLVPLVLGKYPYQSYKLMISVIPLSAVGLSLIADDLGRLTPLMGKKFSTLKNGLACGLLLPVVASTLGMTWRVGTGTTEAEIGRGGAHQWLHPSIQAARAYLESAKERSFLIDWYDDFFGGAYLNGWLCYWARQNRIWLTNPRISDQQIQPPGFDPREAGPNFYFLSQKGESKAVGHAVSLVWAFAPVTVHEIIGEDWAIVSQVKNPNGLESEGPIPFFWVGGESSEIMVLAGRKGWISLKATLYPGPYLPSGHKGSLVLEGPDGFKNRIDVAGPSPVDWNIPVRSGMNKIRIYSPNCAVIPPGSADPRPLLVQVRNLQAANFQ